jgi:hypothetical protein
MKTTSCAQVRIDPQPAHRDEPASTTGKLRTDEAEKLLERRLQAAHLVAATSA